LLFSSLSGIELNIEKTEILQLNLDSTNVPFMPIHITVNNNRIKTSEIIKICGITFSNNKDKEYKCNILDKIDKLEKQLVRWLPRFLLMEGKLTIVKTFGLSQMIYVLQMCNISIQDIKLIESMIFKFLWNTKWVGNRAPDRIKREYLKSSYEKGGLKAPDIKALNNALKTKQFIRAMISDHQINLLQKYGLR